MSSISIFFFFSFYHTILHMILVLSRGVLTSFSVTMFRVFLFFFYQFSELFMTPNNFLHYVIVFISIFLILMFNVLEMNSFFILKSACLSYAILQLISVLFFPSFVISFPRYVKLFTVFQIDFVCCDLSVYISSAKS